jgi:RNA polymerase sigma-70 factor (ECF subfamily)
VKAFKAERAKIEHLKPWILRIAIRCCSDSLRKMRRRQFKETVLFWLERSGSPEKKAEEIVENKEETEQLSHMLAKLPPKTRIVLTLKYGHDMKNNEIAEILDIPLGTVKSRIHSGLKQMKRFADNNPLFIREGGIILEQEHRAVR